MVARLSSRVFLGKDLCRNERWLEITKGYTIDSFAGAYILRIFPAASRPFVHWFIPQLQRLRKAIKDAHRLIDPEVERRKAKVQEALEAGRKPPKVSDTIGWMHEVSRGRKIDYVAGQLSLSLAAIHTTTETTTQAMLDICEHPEVVQPLREEIIQVIGEHGWAKTSLYKLKLIDSFLKESQRLHSLSECLSNPSQTHPKKRLIWTPASMNRYVEREIQLSDGTVLPKGSRILVASRFMDPKIYPEPEKFDAGRFLSMRQQPGQENNFQFVSTSPEHILFGLGQHACPGRFFAAKSAALPTLVLLYIRGLTRLLSEIKIAICHLLLKYDWRLPSRGQIEYQQFESTLTASQTVQVEVRRRKEEIAL